MTARPSHLVAHAGDRQTLCGVRTNTPDALPLLAMRWLSAHVDGAVRAGRDLAVCPVCERESHRHE
jgi:hypothetical protein